MAAFHGELGEVSESPSSPGRSRAFAESGGINLKELVLDYSNSGAAVPLRAQKLAKSARSPKAGKDSRHPDPYRSEGILTQRPEK